MIAAAVQVVRWDGVRVNWRMSLMVADSTGLSPWFTKPTGTDDGGDYDCKCNKNTCHRSRER